MDAPLADVRVIAVEQYGAGPVGDDAARGPRRGRDQDRGSVRRRRCRPLRASLPGGRELALLRDLQPQQAERLARPSPSRRRAACSRISSRPPTRVFSNLRGDQPDEARPALRATSSTSTRGSSAARSPGFGVTGPARDGGRLRLHAAGARGLAERHRRPGRPADEERALARRLLRRLRRGARDPRRGLARAARRARRRRRPLAVRGRARAAQLHRHVGRVARLRARAAAELGAPVDGAVPELRHDGRLARRRLPEAEALAEALRGDRASPSSPTTSASRSFAERDANRDELLAHPRADLRDADDGASGSTC